MNPTTRIVSLTALASLVVFVVFAALGWTSVEVAEVDAPAKSAEQVACERATLESRRALDYFEQLADACELPTNARAGQPPPLTDKDTRWTQPK
jgi:hypothetical protein